MQHAPIHQSYGAHDHDFFEIALIASGRAIHRCIGGDHILNTGHLLVLRPGGWHEYLDRSRFSLFNCLFSRDLFNHELAWVLNDPVLYPIFLGGHPTQRIFLTQLSSQGLKNCRGHLHSLRKLNDAAPLFRAQQIGLLLQIFGEIAQSHAPAANDAAPLHGKLHLSVVKAMHLLESQIDHSWTLTELAKALSINASYLARLFKGSIGMPPMTYLAHCRDQRAADLLLATDLPIAEIARKVGWDDPNYFARRFSKVFGKSPTAYRTDSIPRRMDFRH